MGFDAVHYLVTYRHSPFLVPKDIRWQILLREHLITCDLNSKEMATVDHCINKLKLLDAKGKIWGQDMILQLNDTIFKLVDIETKSIRDSQAILNSCIYNSVLAVTIKDRSKKNTSVFLFQCEEIS
eukprot:g42921.t1